MTTGDWNSVAGLHGAIAGLAGLSGIKFVRDESGKPTIAPKQNINSLLFDSENFIRLRQGKSRLSNRKLWLNRQRGVTLQIQTWVRENIKAMG